MPNDLSFASAATLQVGLTLIIHVKPRNMQDGSRKRLPAQMYNLPGAGLGRQIYPGSVTQMHVVGPRGNGEPTAHANSQACAQTE